MRYRYSVSDEFVEHPPHLRDGLRVNIGRQPRGDQIMRYFVC